MQLIVSTEFSPYSPAPTYSHSAETDTLSNGMRVVQHDETPINLHP